MKGSIREGWTRFVFAAALATVTGGAGANANGPLIQNGGFEEGVYAPYASPPGWGRTEWRSGAKFRWLNTFAREGSRSVRIAASTPNDVAWTQSVAVNPNTNYLLSGWIKTKDVAHTAEFEDAGANLALMNTWQHSQPTLGTRGWTLRSLVFNPRDANQVEVGLRLGYWVGTTTGTAWFDDIRLREIRASDPHPAWRILVLIYRDTDFQYTDDKGIPRHVLAHMTDAEADRAQRQATRFVTQDIPRLTSGNMFPTVTVRYPTQALSSLESFCGYWPSPANTATQRDPRFDSVIVVWDSSGVDQLTGQPMALQNCGGLTPGQGVGQTYATIQMDVVTDEHRNVFKHEWGHSALFYFDAAGTAPAPTVDNHIGASRPYVHCGTGTSYVLRDETDANPIPNSIYNDLSGFTHDYYSGETAVPEDSASCIGITPAAWASGGPVSKPRRYLPPDPLTVIGWTQVHVRHFARARAVTWNTAQPLLHALDAATTAVNEARKDDAREWLDSFIAMAQDFTASGILSPSNAATLVEGAQRAKVEL